MGWLNVVLDVVKAVGPLVSDLVSSSKKKKQERAEQQASVDDQVDAEVDTKAEERAGGTTVSKSATVSTSTAKTPEDLERESLAQVLGSHQNDRLGLDAKKALEAALVGGLTPDERIRLDAMKEAIACANVEPGGMEKYGAQIFTVAQDLTRVARGEGR